MRRLITTVLAAALVGSTLAAAGTTTVPVDGTFGATTTITADGDRTLRLELERDALLLTASDARVGGQPAVELAGGDPSLTGLLISPVGEQGVALWQQAAIRITRLYDLEGVHVEVLNGASRFAARHPGSWGEDDEDRDDDLGLHLARGVYEIAVLGGRAPLTASLRLVTDDAQETYSGAPQTHEATLAADVLREEVEPSTIAPDAQNAIVWGGGVTHGNDGETLTIGAFRAEFAIDATNVHYTFSECDFPGEAGVLDYSPGCPNVQGSNLSVFGGSFGVVRAGSDGELLSYWQIDSRRETSTRSLGVAFTATRPVDAALHIVVLNPGDAA